MALFDTLKPVEEAQPISEAPQDGLVEPEAPSLFESLKPIENDFTP